MSLWSRLLRSWNVSTLIPCGLTLLAALPASATAAGDLAGRLGIRGPAALYAAACAACHGADGSGTAQQLAGFERPATFPHFNACDETTPESTRDWKAVIRDGGRARGFSEIMPAFGKTLTSAQMDELLVYLRSMCGEPGWALGELNVPRALVTEKAFPESETVLTTAVNTKGARAISNELAYERILGKRDQLEVAIPFGWVPKEGGGLQGGIGDVALGVKHVVYAHLNGTDGQPPFKSTGSILSLQGEIQLATGNEARGLGTGANAVGIFGAYDLVLPASTFVQLQGGVDLPLHTDRVPSSAFVRMALGKSISEGDGFGRLWSPMIEVVGDRDLSSGANTTWDVVPEVQATLNRRQHVRAAVGYRLPVNETAGRPRELTFYVLWDWFDGGLLEGW